MTSFATYLLISTLCISINYLFYIFLVKKNTQIKFLRLYLVSSIVLSLILPFNTFNINTSFFYAQEDVIAPLEISNNLNSAIIKDQKLIQTSSGLTNQINWIAVLWYVYLSIVSFLLLKLIYNLIKLAFLYRKSEKEYTENITLIYNHKLNSSFSLFHWVFIPHALKSTKEVENIITHEKVHAHQYHSYDLLLTEFLIIFSWFNPLVWIIKKDLELVHEYLADEGVLNTGINKSDYQALLVNQVAEEQLIRISSNFNHSLIKKRVIMMSKEKNHNSNKRSLLNLIPVTIILFLGVSLANGQISNDENSTLNNSNNYTVTKIIPRVKETSNLTAYLKIEAKETKLKGVYQIELSELKKLTNLKVYCKAASLNSNSLEVLSYTINRNIDGSRHTYTISSDNFNLPHPLFTNLKEWDTVWIDEIKVKTQDNTTKIVNPIALTIK